MRPLALIVLAFLIASCGGGGGTDRRLNAGFYRGALHFDGSGGLPAGTATAVGNVLDSGEVELFLFGKGLEGELADGTLRIDGSSRPVSVEVGALGNTGSLMVREDGTQLAQGAITRAPLPSLGSATQIPVEAEYAGELVVIVGGRVVGAGAVAATVQQTDRIAAAIHGAPNWIGDGVFSGRLNPDGAITDAILTTEAGIIGQDAQPRFSFDGETLVVRFEGMRQSGGTALLTLRKVPEGG